MRKMKVIAIINNKGGVGKSTTVSSLANILGEEYNKKILIVDLDPQGNVSNLYSNDKNDEDATELLVAMMAGKDVLGNGCTVEDLLLNPHMDVHTCISKTFFSKIDIIKSRLTLSECEERLKADVKTPQQIRLKNHLDKVKSEYDYCIIDCSPSVSILNINALACADEVYIPMNCDAWSVMGMCIIKNLINTVSTYNPALKLEGCFFTDWTSRGKTEGYVKELLGLFAPNDLLPIRIRRSKIVEELSIKRIPLLEYERKKMIKNQSKALQDYRKLAEYIISGNRKSLREKFKIELDQDDQVK